MTKENIKPKNILLFGNNWHGNFSYFLAENLRKLGHTVIQMHMTYGGDMRLPWNRIRKNFFIKKLNADIQNIVVTRNIDLVIATTPFNILPTTWDFIYSRNIQTVAWFGDNPLWKSGQLEGITKYKSAFLPDEEWVAPLKFLNENSFYLPHATDETVFRPLSKYNEKPVIDVLFVAHPYIGTGDGILRATILNELAKSGIKIILYGPSDWKILFKRFPLLAKGFIDKKVSSEELNILYNSSKIVLNIHHSQLFAGTNQRTFETGSAGVFQLSDYKKAVIDLHGNGSAVFHSIPEAIEKVHYYLANNQERAAYAERVRQIVLSGHTYQHRINHIFDYTK